MLIVFPAAVVVTALRIAEGVNSNINTHLRVDEILVGGWLAFLSMRHGDSLRRWLAPAWVGIPVIIILAGLFMVSSHDRGGALVYLRPYLAMALVGAVMHCNLRAVLALLEGRVAGYIARISYALYIWHPLMVFGFMNSGSTLERYLLKRPVSYALTWAAAHLSTTYWESFWQRSARHLLAARGKT